MCPCRYKYARRRTRIAESKRNWCLYWFVTMFCQTHVWGNSWDEYNNYVWEFNARKEFISVFQSDIVCFQKMNWQIISHTDRQLGTQYRKWCKNLETKYACTIESGLRTISPATVRSIAYICYIGSRLKLNPISQVLVRENMVQYVTVRR